MLARSLNLALGAWLVAAALLLADAGDPARAAELSAGVALVLVALLAPARPARSPGPSPAAVLGGWLMLAPSVLAYPSAASAVVDVVTGTALVAIALHPDLGGRRAARA